MTDQSPAPTGAPDRQIPVEALLGRYRRELGEKTEALYVAQATAEAAEAECAQLRLRVIELEGASA